MSKLIKDLGAVSAYAYAVEKGYTGTEDEFAELMYDYTDVAQTAVEAKDEAVSASASAQASATTANTKADEASASASKAQSASDSAQGAETNAETFALNAGTKATEAKQFADKAELNAQKTQSDKEAVKSAKSDVLSAVDNAQNYANSAQSASQAIQNMNVEATTLEPDSDATVEKTVDAISGAVTLTYGIPKGQVGEKGDKGDTGGSGVYIGTSAPSDENVNVWIDSNGEPDISDLKSELNAIDLVIGNPNICNKSVVIEAIKTITYIARDITVKAGEKYIITFSIPDVVENIVYCHVMANGEVIDNANINAGNVSATVILSPTSDITDLAIAAQVTKNNLIGLRVTGDVKRQGSDYITENTNNISNIKTALGDGVFFKVDYTVETGGITGTIGSEIGLSTSTNYNRTCIGVVEGELYKISANVNANVEFPSAYFTDNNDIVVATALNVTLSAPAVVSEVVEAPPNATKLYVRDRNRVGNSTLSIGKCDRNISDIVTELFDGSVLNIPEYYATHMVNKVDAINNISNINVNTSVTQEATKLLQFIFITDYHYDNSGKDYDNTQHSAALIEYLQKNIGLDFVCHGGDIINNKSTQKEAIQYINDFRNVFGRVNNLYYCIGNHEYNSTEGLTWAQITKLLNGNRTNIMCMDPYGDYYIDDNATKTRYLFMGCDRRSTSGAMISSGQITWFLESLSNTPNDYDCVLFIHRLLELTFDTEDRNINVSVYSDCDEIANGIDAFNERSPITYNDVTYDYSSKAGYFICALTGHSHTDASMTLASGTPLIMVTTDCLPKRHTSYDWENSTWKNEATRETVEEQAFDVVTIDKENKKIYCTRIGYGSNREFSY